jgi:hypothetical protein
MACSTITSQFIMIKSCKLVNLEVKFQYYIFDQGEEDVVRYVCFAEVLSVRKLEFVHRGT